MSQNFSQMSDIYIPELIELDSYWQKAVEDAICDTLKGEKRLHYALKNRKKINQKLQQLGLKPMYSQMSFSGDYQLRSGSLEGNQEADRKSPSKTEWDSVNENSTTSFGSAQDEDFHSQGVPERRSGSVARSRSRETPPDKRYRNPERPLLGDASLEKMKKSRNSFNCEPMGAEEAMSESDNEDIYSELLNDDVEEDDKKIECLHVRENSHFDDSDTEGSRNGTPKVVVEKDGFEKHPTLKDRNYFLSHVSAPLTDSLQRNDYKIPMTLDPQEDVFWENEVKSAIRENAGVEKRLCLALAKREILKENLKSLRMAVSSDEIHINESQAKCIAKGKKSRKLLSPFIRFYLDVYRELCHKCPAKEIANEAVRRWWSMSGQEKCNYDSKTSKK